MKNEKNKIMRYIKFPQDQRFHNCTIITRYHVLIDGGKIELIEYQDEKGVTYTAYLRRDELGILHKQPLSNYGYIQLNELIENSERFELDINSLPSYINCLPPVNTIYDILNQKEKEKKNDSPIKTKKQAIEVFIDTGDGAKEIFPYFIKKETYLYLKNRGFNFDYPEGIPWHNTNIWYHITKNDLLRINQIFHIDYKKEKISFIDIRYYRKVMQFVEDLFTYKDISNLSKSQLITAILNILVKIKTIKISQVNEVLDQIKILVFYGKSISWINDFSKQLLNLTKNQQLTLPTFKQLVSKQCYFLRIYVIDNKYYIDHNAARALFKENNAPYRRLLSDQEYAILSNKYKIIHTNEYSQAIRQPQQETEKKDSLLVTSSRISTKKTYPINILKDFIKNQIADKLSKTEETKGHKL